MQTVTDAFKTAIDADVRDIRAKVVIDWVGNYISGDATASASGTKDATNTPPSQAINGKVNPYRKWALADRAKADGTFYACPSDGNREMGWHNDLKSDASTSEGPNKISNPSFENYTGSGSSTDFTDWIERRCYPNGDIQAYTADYHSGVACCMLQHDSVSSVEASSGILIEVNENSHYVLSGWFKEIAGKSKLSFGFRCLDENKWAIGSTKYVCVNYEVGTAWEQVLGTAHPSSETSEPLRFEAGTKYVLIRIIENSGAGLPPGLSQTLADDISLKSQDIHYGFSTNPWLQVDFGSPKTIKDIVVNGDQLLNHYPTSFLLEYYDTAWHTLLDIGENFEATYYNKMDSPIANINKLKLTIRSVNLANSYAKIVEFGGGFSEEYTVDDIDTLRILKERQFSEGSLPIGNASANSLDLVLDNTNNDFFPQNIHSPYYGLFRDNRRIHAYLGLVLADESIEWLKQGIFYSGDWKCPDNSPTASTSALDRAKLLMQSQFSTSVVYQNQTISYLVEQVLVDAGLDTSEYQIDTISTTIPYCWFEPMSHWAALKKLAEACCANMYFDENGVFRFESRAHLAGHTTSQFTIQDTVNLFSCDNPFSYSEVRNYIEVVSKPLAPDTQQEIYNMQEASFSLPAGETQNLTLFFSKKPSIDIQTPVITATGDGHNIHIESWTAYAWGGNLILHNSGSNGTVTEITVQGKPLISTGEIRAISKDDSLIAEQGAKKYTLENDFIQGQGYAQTIADYILATYKAPEKDVDVTCRGNFALELGDRVTVINAINSVNADYWVLKDELTFDGGLESKILGRKAS